MKKMIEKVLALVMVVCMLTAVAFAEEVETVEAAPAPVEVVEVKEEVVEAVETVEETETVEEATEEAAEEIVEEVTEEEIPEDAQLVTVIEDEEHVERSVSIYASYEGDHVELGDKVALYAVLEGYEGVDYRIQWQDSDDNREWNDISGANGEKYVITVTEENCSEYFRVSVTSEEA